MKKRNLFVCLLTTCSLTLTSCNSDPKPKVDYTSHKYSNFYHIFVPSFRDSNEDGIGDLNGIIDSLDYLEDLGITALYLSPIFEADSYHKYDAINYYNIDPDFGDKKIFVDLIDSAHEKGINIILDTAFNHVSVENDDFVEAYDALKNDPICVTPDPITNRPSQECITKYPKVDYFRFVKSGSQFENGYSNFKDKLENTAYDYEVFSNGSRMADYNLENPAVIQIIDEVIKYYISDMKIDGFRLDAITSFFGNSSTGIGNFQKTSELLDHIQKEGEKYNPNFYTVAEGPWSTRELFDEEDNLMDNTNLDSYFSFDTSLFGSMNSKNHILNYADQAINIKQGKNEERLVAGLENIFKAEQDDKEHIKSGNKIQASFFSNHDTSRVSSKFVNGVANSPYRPENKILYLDAAKFCYGIQNLAQGNFFLYYGDEIGMTGQKDSMAFGDTMLRQPMLWDDEKIRPELPDLDTDTSRFNTAQETLDQYGTMGEQMEDQNSLYNYLKRMFNLKKKLPQISTNFASSVRTENNLTIFDKGDITVVINPTSNKVNYKLNNKQVVEELNLNNQQLTKTDSSVTLDKYSIIFLK